jgi:hypothetical protein
MRTPLLGWGGPGKADNTPEALGGVSSMYAATFREAARDEAGSNKFFGGASGDQRAD